MLSVFKTRFAAFPTPAGGLALGIASLASLWGARLDGATAIAAAGAAVAAAIVFCLIVKFAANPRLLLSDVAHPVAGSVLPTAAMATMVVSRSLPQDWAAPVWLAAVAVHGLLLAAFLAFRIPVFRPAHMVPSWYVPPIGPVVAVLTLPDPRFSALAEGILWFGIASYAAMLAPMLARLIFAAEVPDAAKPTIAILAAPPNLCLAGYLSFETAPSALVVLPLLSVGLVMTAAVYLGMARLLRLPFSPGYAAFTFPLVISANATLKAAAFLAATAPGAAAGLEFWGNLELAVATLTVAYVALRYGLAYGRRVADAAVAIEAAVEEAEADTETEAAA